ncbi:MAG TPA: GNAT family N-acetyltransferase [Gammaproteobacteria bacterium]|nr:GNAT family N-acetyltransferase [Gammaproteobacteria bacterium]
MTHVVRQASWREDEGRLRQVREAVFIREQQVPAELEWDEADRTCIHALVEDAEGLPLGVGRLLPDGQIGRMAVRREARGQGIGGAVLEFLIGQARTCNFAEVWLHGQTHAVTFYEQHGFVAEGETFMEAGIPHRMMRCALR